MYRYIFLFLLALSSCQNKPSNELNEFTVEIKNDSIYYHQNDSVFDKLVYVKNNFNLLIDSNNLLILLFILSTLGATKVAFFLEGKKKIGMV